MQYLYRKATHLRRGQTSLGQLVDLVLNLLRSSLQPGRRRPLVRQGRLGDTLSTRVHASHLWTIKAIDSYWQDHRKPAI